MLCNRPVFARFKASALRLDGSRQHDYYLGTLHIVIINCTFRFFLVDLIHMFDDIIKLRLTRLQCPLNIYAIDR